MGCMVRILQVIHGYPMRYNAGSEVYTQGLAQALAERHEVHVFTRQENGFPSQNTHAHQETDPSDPRITLHVVNMARARDGYRHSFRGRRLRRSTWMRFGPDIVHVGHLNHLIHLPCFRGESSVRFPVDIHPSRLLADVSEGPVHPDVRQRTLQTYGPVCDGQDDRKCAVRCYVRYFSGSEEEYEADASHWTDWVGRRMGHIRKVCDDCGYVHRTIQVSHRGGSGTTSAYPRDG